MNDENKKINHQDVTVQLAEISDENFLQSVYADSRRDEFAMFGWSREQEEAFFKMQFQLQKQAYRLQFPGADCYVVKLNNTPVGRMIIYRDETESRLVDISLLAKFRGQGIGIILLEKLKVEIPDGKPFNLRVSKTNLSAKRFYERLGFSVIEDEGLHFSMQWRKS